MEWRNLLIKENMTVKETLQKMDIGGEKILFIVDNNSCLLGSLTDGDIRRSILSGGRLEDKINQVFNSSPLCLKNGYMNEEAKKIMLQHKIEVVPVVDDSGHIIDAVSWTDLFEKDAVFISEKIPVPVVIMAGGKGERLTPFTKILPKPLIPIGEKTVIEKIIDNFNRYGIEHFYVTLNYKGEIIKTYLESIEKKYKVDYVWEKEFLGTAGSLKLIAEQLKDNFIVSNSDNIVELDCRDLLIFHKENKNVLTVVGSIQYYKISYGIIHFEKNGKVRKIEEKPEFEITVNTGVYVLSKEAIDFIPENKCFHMTNLIQILLDKGKNVGMYPVSQKSYLDVGQWEEYRKAIEKFKLFE